MKVIKIKIVLFGEKADEVGIARDFFDISKGLSQKKLFALYQRARADLNITKYSVKKSRRGNAEAT